MVGCLDPENFKEFKLVKRTQLSHNVATFRFDLPTPKSVLGLPIGQHISCRFILLYFSFPIHLIILLVLNVILVLYFLLDPTMSLLSYYITLSHSMNTPWCIIMHYSSWMSLVFYSEGRIVLVKKLWNHILLQHWILMLDTLNWLWRLFATIFFFFSVFDYCQFIIFNYRYWLLLPVLFV